MVENLGTDVCRYSVHNKEINGLSNPIGPSGATQGQTPIPDRFAAAIDYSITVGLDCCLHPIEMAEVLKRKAEELTKEAGQ